MTAQEWIQIIQAVATAVVAIIGAFAVYFGRKASTEASAARRAAETTRENVRAWARGQG